MQLAKGAKQPAGAIGPEATARGKVGLGRRDPKNPWPPPDTGSLDTAQMANSTWLVNTLTIDGAQIVERGD